MTFHPHDVKAHERHALLQEQGARRHFLRHHGVNHTRKARATSLREVMSVVSWRAAREREKPRARSCRHGGSNDEARARPSRSASPRPTRPRRNDDAPRRDATNARRARAAAARATFRATGTSRRTAQPWSRRRARRSRIRDEEEQGGTGETRARTREEEQGGTGETLARTREEEQGGTGETRSNAR